jgi:hypothetical protein
MADCPDYVYQILIRYILTRYDAGSKIFLYGYYKSEYVPPLGLGESEIQTEDLSISSYKIQGRHDMG